MFKSILANEIDKPQQVKVSLETNKQNLNTAKN